MPTTTSTVLFDQHRRLAEAKLSVRSRIDPRSHTIGMDTGGLAEPVKGWGGHAVSHYPLLAGAGDAEPSTDRHEAL